MTTIRLPGLIDPHVHLRDPGATHKEDYATGTAAALAGGFHLRARHAQQCAARHRRGHPGGQAGRRPGSKARCDYGIHLGAGADNIATAAALAPQVTGLKMYLDQTFGPLRLDDLGALMAHAERWPRDRPLLCHAEGRTIAAAILVAHLSGAPIHICHVSRADEIELIRRAKDRGIRVTCEATPHHLFLTEDDAAAIGAGRARGAAAPGARSRSGCLASQPGRD